MLNEIGVDELVQWTCPDHGELTGSVLDIVRDIENGRAFAIVEIDHELPGILHSVPMDLLKRKKA